LPDIEHHSKHKNLEKRWLWFLDLAHGGMLTQANHNKIADGIYLGLMSPVPVYDHITFDAVESAGVQDVSVTAHLEEGVPAVQIVLVTPPIQEHAGPGNRPPKRDD
jgi:hypothetical protein